MRCFIRHEAEKWPRRAMIRRMPASSRHVIVIGAGLAGLAAARRLHAAGLQVTVLEHEREAGGRARTALLPGGFQVELGAEFLASFYTRTLALIDELGLRSALRRIPSSAAILRAGQLYSLWPNARIAFTRLIGAREKLNLAYLAASLMRHGPLLDLTAFARAQPIDDCSVSDYARAHLSEEVLEYVLQPPLAGIFYWTPERTSRALLMLVLRAGLSHPAGLRLFTFRDGIGQLARALARPLSIQYGWSAAAIEPCAEGFHVRAQQGHVFRVFHADAVIVATTAGVVPLLAPWLGAARLALFAEVHYSRTATLAIATRRRLPSGYYGLLFPRSETPYIASATIQAIKSVSAVPPGQDLIALHMAGPAAAALRQLPDEMISRLLLTELRRVAPAYDPTPNISVQRLFRCHEALPEFDVGHFSRLAQFADPAFTPPGLVFAGDYLGGPFVEGAILSGEAAADRLIRH
jgi:protoporphyrinogen/coproporphyrinogen III oxidase